MKDNIATALVLLFFLYLIFEHFSQEKIPVISKGEPITLTATEIRSPDYESAGAFRLREDYEAPITRSLKVLAENNDLLNARHCTEWAKKAVLASGYRYRGREFNGWWKLSGRAEEREIAPMEELEKVRPGWLVEFVNNNSSTGRHAGIITEIYSIGSEGFTADLLSFDGIREIHTKKYYFVSRESGLQSEEKKATINVPIIATYKPIK